MTPWRHEGGRQSAYSCGGSHGLVCNKRTVFPFNSFLKKERNRRSRLNGLHTRQSSAKSGVEPKPLLYSDRLCGLFSRRIASIVSGKDSAMINIHRRTAALITLLAPFAASAAAAQTAPHKMPDMGAGTRRDMTKVPWMGSEEIAMLVYPGMTVMDLIGLHCMFGSLMGAKIHIVAKSLAPVTSDAGLTIVPGATFETCPRDLTVLFTGWHAGRSQRSRTPCLHGRSGRQGQICDERLLRLADPRRGGIAERVQGHIALVVPRCPCWLRRDPEPPFDAGSMKTAPDDIKQAMTEMAAEFSKKAELLAAASKI